MGGGLWFVVVVPSASCQASLREKGHVVIEMESGDKKPIDRSPSGELKSLVEELEQILEMLNITDAIWLQNTKQTHFQVSFPCFSGEQCDLILDVLTSRGIGQLWSSTVGVVPVSVLYSDSGRDQDDVLIEVTSERKQSEAISSKPKTDLKKGFRNLQKKFLKSVTARLTVAQVVEEVRNNADLSFDFVAFTVVASLLAALGLVENSSVILVASMLISPLMGPIMAGTFGLVVRDRRLASQGVTSETVALLMCLLCGFLFGLACGYFSDSWGQGAWPTEEMTSRGLLRSLWVGALIALPSGAGVALSILGGNAASLVGVAISASLLPPLVNAGLLWALAAIKFWKSLGEEALVVSGPPNPAYIKPALSSPKDYSPVFSDSMDVECGVLGVVSLGLTLVNIVCIVLMAVLVLKVKEVAPLSSKASRFWNQDIKIARDYNRRGTLRSTEPEGMGDEVLKEWATLTGLDPADVMKPDPTNRLTQLQTLQDIVQDVESDQVYQAVVRTVQPGRPLSQRLSYLAAMEEQRLLEQSRFPSLLQPPRVAFLKGEPVPGTVRRKRSAPTATKVPRPTTARPVSLWLPVGDQKEETSC